jgi:hypothetical protein
LRHSAPIYVHLLERLTVQLNVDHHRGERTRDSCRGAQDLAEQLRCVRSPARCNRAHVPYYGAAGVEIRRCNQQQATLFVFLGDMAKKLFGDVLGNQFRQWLCIG